MNKEDFGKFIAETRRNFGLTQRMLAERLHVTDKAVSKWERGLCYPDLTLIEKLADALEVSVAELMMCRKEPEKTFSGDSVESSADALLDIANESHRRQRKTLWLTAAVLMLAGIVIASLIYLAVNAAVSGSGYVVFVGRKINEEGCFVYIETEGKLLRLRCRNQQVYDELITDGEQEYYVEYIWNRLTSHGTLNWYEPAEDGVFSWSPMEEQGNIADYGSLLGQAYALMEYMDIYPDPDREKCYLYTFRFYYRGGGESYYWGKEVPETDILTVENCRATVAFDYDEDGIAELFVLTKYDEEPYLLYDLSDSELTSRFVDEVPLYVLMSWVESEFIS